MSDTDHNGDGAEASHEGPPIKLVGLLVLVVALAVFVFQNADDTPVRFLWFDANWPVWGVIAISVIAGIALGRLASWQWRRTRRRADRPG